MVEMKKHNTGTIRPMEIMSISTVIKMKRIAAGRKGGTGSSVGFAAEDEFNSIIPFGSWALLW